MCRLKNIILLLAVLYSVSSFAQADTDTTKHLTFKFKAKPKLQKAMDVNTLKYRDNYYVGGVNNGHYLTPVLGLIYQKQLFMELGLMHSNAESTASNFVNNLPALIAYKLSTEFNFNFNHFMMAPKLGLEFDPTYFCFRVNIIDFTDFKTNDFRFTPEVGFGLIGIITLCFGWNIPLTHTEVPNITTYSIALHFNLAVL